MNDQIKTYTQAEFKRLLLNSSTVYKVNPEIIERGICIYCATMTVLQVTNIDLARNILLNMYSKDALFSNNCDLVWIKQINSVFNYLTSSTRNAFVYRTLNELSDNRYGLILTNAHAIAYYKNGKSIWICDNVYLFKEQENKNHWIPGINKILKLDESYFEDSKIVYLQDNRSKWFKIPLKTFKTGNYKFAELTRTRFSFDYEKVNDLEQFYTDPDLLFDKNTLRILNNGPDTNRSLWVYTFMKVLRLFRAFGSVSRISSDCSRALKRFSYFKSINIKYLKDLYLDVADMKKIYRLAIELGYKEDYEQFLKDDEYERERRKAKMRTSK